MAFFRDGLRLLALAAVLAAAAGAGAVPAAGEGPRTSAGQTVYVPVYSHIYSGDRERPILLAVTVSVRNVDPTQPITLVQADYHDSQGRKLKSFLAAPLTIPPLGSERFVIAESDKRGGSGASFILRWEAAGAVHAPLMESVMVGTQSQLGLTFTSRGVVIAEGG